MTQPPKIDVRDLRSVRAAANGKDDLSRNGWDLSEDPFGKMPIRTAAKGGWWALRRASISRKIVTFNLVAILVLTAGVLYLSPSRDSLVFQRGLGLVNETQLIANAFEVRLQSEPSVQILQTFDAIAQPTLDQLELRGGVQVFVFDAGARAIAQATGRLNASELADLQPQAGDTYVTDTLAAIADWLTKVLALETAAPQQVPLDALIQRSVNRSFLEGRQLAAAEIDDNTALVVTTPIRYQGVTVGVIATATASGEIDSLVRREREQYLRLFFVGISVSVGLSFILGSTIANPLAQLAAAAEANQEANTRRQSPGRVRIPDLTARPDEIGRLSGALRRMVAVLYQRIEGNEQFAADVAHEIKNPLASLRSAVGTMRVAKRDDQRERLLEVIEHDVKRLDRLVSDISNASRLDSELVKEREEQFDLVKLLRNITDYMGDAANERGVDFIVDLPDTPIITQGLEGRLAQVFVNLITNATSFCEEGDAVRVWVRARDDRVLAVVEDTGPGIPEEALTKVFQRFYSERPEGEFGNHSGLGLAISRQIIEAHGGVIWAENIRAADDSGDGPSLGARFVVGLPM